MKNFIKNILSSCLGSIIAMIIVLGLLFVMMIGMASFFSDMSSLQSSGSDKGEKVLYLELPASMPELTNNEDVGMNFVLSSSGVKVGVQDLIRLINIAKDDKGIKGIVIDPKVSTISYSSVGNVRKALEEFKASGKFIYAYADYMSQKNYYLASVADSVFINPNGGISLEGMGMTNVYLKNLLDKLEIEPEIFYVGNFKSATEPLRRTDMSEEDRLQRKNYLNTLFSVMVDDIAGSRNLDAREVRKVSDNYELRDANDALNKGFVDGLIYYSDFNDILKERLGLKGKDKFSPYNIQTYYNKNKTKLISSGSDEIAVIYAEGSIEDGDNKPGAITNDQYVKLLRKLQSDDKIKGVILRVDSPGGSAMVSDNIWYEIEKLKAAGKKVVVSMGTYAASGGYYISCNADYIFAEPTTLTGSIGVFGVMMNTSKFFNNKLGITFDTVQTGKFTNSFSGFVNKDEEVKEIIQKSVDEIYEQFIGRVATGRSMDIEKVKEIAQGHIYSGVDALEIGLVDELGDLYNAVDKMAELLGTDDYKIKEYPQLKSPLEQFLKQLSGDDAPKVLAQSQLPQEYRSLLKEIDLIKKMDGVQARLPFIIMEYSIN